jgi:hypothetical protein
MKVAPLGWSKPFVDPATNVAVYQSINPYSRRNFLRVDDSDNLSLTDLGATYMRGYEYMTSAVDNGSYGFPLKSVLPRGGFFRKNLYNTAGIYIPADGSNIAWTMVGNSNQFFFSTNIIYGNVPLARSYVFFGDLVSYVPGDVGATGLSIDIVNDSQYSSPSSIANAFSYGSCFSPRNSKRLHSLSSQRWKLWNQPTVAPGAVFGVSLPIAEPDVYSNKIILYRPFYITDEQNSNSIRGEMPGVSIVLNDLVSLPVKYEAGQVITLNSERFVYMPTYNWSNIYGFFLLTLDRDWNIPIT